jgi:hypothetical protein
MFDPVQTHVIVTGYAIGHWTLVPAAGAFRGDDTLLRRTTMTSARQSARNGKDG